MMPKKKTSIDTKASSNKSKPSNRSKLGKSKKEKTQDKSQGSTQNKTQDNTNGKTQDNTKSRAQDETPDTTGEGTVDGSTKKSNKKQDSGVEETSQGEKGVKKPPKFKFVCQKCGICCSNELINITLTDIERWVEDKTIYRILHLLTINDSEGRIQITLKKDNDGKCNLYHRDNKTCTIYDSRPLFCRSFPLGFNGESYFLKSSKCKGLKSDKMTKNQLESIRNSAFEEYIANRQIIRILPILQTILVNRLLEQSQEFMEKYGNSKESNIE